MLLCQQRSVVKAMVFPVVVYSCKSWTIKKAERRRTDAFELWCWRRLLRVSWTARRSNQSILREINPDYSLKGLLLEAKALILWPLNGKSRLIGKDPDAGKDWGHKEKHATEDDTVRWHHQLNGHESEQTPGDGEGQGSLACCSPWGCKESDTTTTPLHSSSSKRFFRRIGIVDFPGGTVDKNPPSNAGDTGSIPDPGKSHIPQGS